VPFEISFIRKGLLQGFARKSYEELRLLIDRICSQTTKLGTLIPALRWIKTKARGRSRHGYTFGYFDKKNLKYKRQKNTSYRKSFSIKLRPLVTSCINL
jgi:hypothetical protein